MAVWPPSSRTHRGRANALCIEPTDYWSAGKTFGRHCGEVFSDGNNFWDNSIAVMAILLSSEKEIQCAFTHLEAVGLIPLGIDHVDIGPTGRGRPHRAASAGVSAAFFFLWIIP